MWSSTLENNNDLLAKLLQARDDEASSNASLTHEEVIDNLLTLVFAGADTTSSAAISVWLVLSQQPELKEQLKKNPGKTEAFVQGILEAFPPAPFNMRKTQEELQLGDYRIPAHWLVGYQFAASLEDAFYRRLIVETTVQISCLLVPGLWTRSTTVSRTILGVQ
jgi:cytochrome P450